MKTVHTAAGDLWRTRMRRPNGELSPRVRSLEVEREFWKGRTYHRDAYAERVYGALRELTAGREIHSVLEIGPGWGNYTLPLAGDFEKLTLVDVSPDNLAYLRGQNLPCQLQTICSPWETAEAEVHDLVFGFNCLYRMEEPEQFLLHMQQTARRLCVIGMGRPPEMPWLPALEQAGISIHYTRQGCEELKAVAEELGLPVKLLSIPNYRSFSYADREALLKRARSFLMEDCPDDTLLSVLLPWHQEGPDGSLFCEYRFQSQLLYWEP